ncbi:alpha/beta fold hydrolase [Massilia cellulosiltytica]|uniref:alpha/beta fold hydrolase n=1 Tax=Massilia cellulosiltytica TaxID=2683234 RepID=UPI0039B57690
MRASRPRLLLVHGLLGSLDYFEPRRYLPGVDLFTPDLIGYGQRRSEDAHITLADQAAMLARFLHDEIGGPAWVLGHSVGGIAAMLLADLVPELVRGVINVEGNFTLKDAFWTGRIAALPDAEWAAEYGAMEAAPAAWLEKSGIEASDERVAWARDILANQPYTTVQAMAQSVLDTTGAPDYLGCVGRVLARATPLYLVGGEQSSAGWDVPDWVLSQARRVCVQPKTGHMMMLEDPGNFCRIVESILYGEGCLSGT